MSQAYTALVGTDTLTASRTTINNTTDALRTLFSGLLEPSTMVAGMLWHDTTTNILKLRNQANGAWINLFPVTTVTNGGLLALTGGVLTGVLTVVNATAAGHAPNKDQVDLRRIIAQTKVTGWNGAVNRPLTEAPSAIVIVQGYIISDTAVTDAGGNNWQIQVHNFTASLNLASAPITTQANPIVAFTRLSLALNQNLTLTLGDVLRLVVTANGTGGTNMSAHEILVVLEYRIIL